MVQEKIGDDNFRRAFRPVKNIRDDGFGAPAEFFKISECFGSHIFLTVKQCCVDILPVQFLRDLPQEISVARANFNDFFWCGWQKIL